MIHRKIVDYQIIFNTDDELEKFEDKVNKAIANNYEPHGTPFMSDNWIHQVMVKYEEDENNE